MTDILQANEDHGCDDETMSAIVSSQDEVETDIVEAGDPVPLRDIEFTDLFISQMGECRMRGAHVHNLEGGGLAPLINLDATALADFEALLNKVVQKADGGEREFALMHDGVNYRVAKIDDQRGVWYALRRMLPRIPRLHEVVRDRTLYRLIGQAGARSKRGLILVAGATGDGKTTSVFSMLQEYLLNYGNIGYTIEDPPEMTLSGEVGKFGQCFQVQVKDGDFKSKLTEALRCRPRYIMVGEIRDSEAASELLRAANSGHVVLSTIHAGAVPEAVQSLARYVAGTMDDELARHLMASCLSLVIHQKLVQTDRGGEISRYPAMEVLEVAGSTAVKSTIREGKYDQLRNHLSLQSDRRAAEARNKSASTSGRKGRRVAR